MTHRATDNEVFVPDHMTIDTKWTYEKGRCEKEAYFYLAPSKQNVLDLWHAHPEQGPRASEVITGKKKASSWTTSRKRLAR